MYALAGIMRLLCNTVTEFHAGDLEVMRYVDELGPQAQDSKLD